VNAMNEVVQLPALMPALPEIVLVVGAMALLMLGAFRGEHTAVTVSWLAIVLLVVAGAITLWLPGGTLVTFGAASWSIPSRVFSSCWRSPARPPPS